MTVERFAGRFSTQQPDQSEAQIKRMAAASWDTTEGMLDLRTRKHPKHHATVVRFRSSLKEYHEAIVRDHLAGNGTEHADKFLGLLSDPESEYFVPTYQRPALNTPFRIIRETVTHVIERPSRGWAKHIRREKAAGRT